MEKKIAVISYVSAACFYIAAIISFLNHNPPLGTVMLCLGSSQLCLGSVHMNKSKKEENNGEGEK